MPDNLSNNLSLLEYGRLLIVRGWIVALCMAILMGGAYLFSARQTRIYRATQVMLVQAGESDANVLQANQRQLNAYVFYLYSTLVADEISHELNLGISGEELKGRAEIAAEPERSIIRIEVNDTDGENANRVAYAWGQKLIQYFNQLNENRTGAERIEALVADFPTYILYRPRLVVNLGLSGVVGLLIGAIIVFILEFRSNRVIRHPEDVEDFDAFPVLASIPASIPAE